MASRTRLASLSEGEKIALMKIARLYARKTPYDKEDLVQEAFARVLVPFGNPALPEIASIQGE